MSVLFLSLLELLSRLLSTAFESYDFESVTTAFLLTRQGALEGPAIFPSYSAWFKVNFLKLNQFSYAAFVWSLESVVQILKLSV